jgi:hypothetical protein
LTLLAIPPEEWRKTLSRLPLGSRFGGRVFGYVDDASVELPNDLAALVDELWTPNDDLARVVSEDSRVPVRVVPPAVEPPVESGRDLTFDLDPERFWFLTVDGGRGSEDDLAVSSAIECVRRLVRDGDTRPGLCLAVPPDKRRLAVQLEHLPIRVVARPLDTEVLNDLISECDGYLDLHHTRRVDPALVKAGMAGKPVVTGWSSGPVNQGEVREISSALQRIVEILAHPEIEEDVASTLGTAVREEYSPENALRVWRQQIDTLVSEVVRKR